MMSYGFDPYLSSWSPYHGAAYAVTESVPDRSNGGDYSKVRFTFQEYFRSMTEDPEMEPAILSTSWCLHTDGIRPSFYRWKRQYVRYLQAY